MMPKFIKSNAVALMENVNGESNVYNLESRKQKIVFSMVKLPLEKIKGKIISSDEKVLLVFGVAPSFFGFWIFLGSLILILALIITIFFVNDFWLALLLGLALIGYGFYLRVAYFYFLTDRRAIFYYRFFHTRLVSIDYQKITDLNVRENFLEKIFFSSGDLAINTAGAPREEIVFKHISDPHLVKRKLEEIKSTSKK